MEDQEKQRTLKQNNAMHRAFREIAQEMYMMGYDMRDCKFYLRPTMAGVKAAFHHVLEKQYPGKTSTTELTTTEVSELWETFNEGIQRTFGIYVTLDGKDEHGFWD